MAALRRLGSVRTDAQAGDAAACVTVLGAVEAASDILAGVTPEALLELDPATRRTGPPDEQALGDAVRTLFDHVVSTRQGRRDELVELLSHSPSIDEDRLYQARRRAEDQRRILASVEMLGTHDLVSLMPDRLNGESNLPRALERLRKQGRLLGVPVRGNWRYPVAQFDERGQVNQPLSDALRRAAARGYDEWEILGWLSTPRSSALSAVEPGRPLEQLATGATLEAIVSGALLDGDPPDEPSMCTPFEWLARGDWDEFEAAAERWLQ